MFDRPAAGTMKRKPSPMILPPFTILIVKDSHRPVTVRITRGFAALLVFMLLILAGAGSFAIHAWLLPQQRGLAIAPATKSEESGRYAAAPVETGVQSSGADSLRTPDVADLTVSQAENGDVSLSFMVANADSELYLWLILNPGGATAGEPTVYPRSPLFRGMPVDYRNGVRHLPGGGRRLAFTFTGPEAGVELERFRVLAYTVTGELLIDRTFAVQTKIRM